MNEDKDNEQVSKIESAINSAVKLDPNNRYLILMDNSCFTMAQGEALKESLKAIGVNCVVGVVFSPQQSVVVHELHKCKCEEVLAEVRWLRAELNHDDSAPHVVFPGCCK